jgi:tryptophan synthase alpha chain
MDLSRPGFSVYLTLGFPKLDKFLKILEELSSCADFYEIGLPTESPKYDGPVVRAAHRQALSAGIKGVEALRHLEGISDIPYTVMAYMEDYAGRLRGLMEAAASAGARCVLLPDLAFDYPERLEDYIEESERAGIKPCFFASSRFPHVWLQRYAALKPLYIYLGLQPATGVKLPIAVEKNVRLARRLVGSSYLLAGFAIRSPKMAAALIRAGADAVVVGSALITLLRENDLEAAKELACRMHLAVHGESSAQHLAAKEVTIDG